MLVYIPVYFVKLKLLRGEKLHIGDRLGFKISKKKSPNKSIWIHAVSVGEVISVQNLIEKIKEKHPDWIIHFSSVTNTGVQVAKGKLSSVDDIFFIPLDFKWIVKKFFRALKPQIFILAESEFWPNLLREATKRTKGVLLINGRISPSSCKRYYRFRFIMRKILKNVDHFLVQTAGEKTALERIGVGSKRVEVAGNLKAEINLPVLSKEEILLLKKDLNILETRKVVIAGSTHKGEEERLLMSFAKVRKEREKILFILAPRHPDRVAEVERIVKSLSLKSVRRTMNVPGNRWDVLILDTVGELSRFYALCDVAFIGGSLIPWGGQNLLEPAFYGKPVFFGPHMQNFSFLAETFIRSGGARVIHNEQDLIDMFGFKDENKLENMGRMAKKTLSSLRGATEKTLKVIEDHMK